MSYQEVTGGISLRRGSCSRSLFHW